MAGYVYILRSKKNSRYYIGSTNDVARRVKQHELGYVYSTKRMLPLDVVLVKRFDSLLKARQEERRLKKLKSRKLIEKIVCSGRSKFGPVAQSVRAADS